MTISSLQSATHWRRICINKISRFIKTTTLHAKMAAQMNLPDGNLVRVMKNGEEILKLRGRTRMQLTSKEEEKP